MPPGVPPEVLDELATRTVGFAGWQREHWMYHCNDAAAFLGLALAFTAMAPRLEWLKRNQRLVQRIGGILMMLVGIAMITGLWDMMMVELRQWVASFGTIL